jgi:hypothetical protein
MSLSRGTISLTTPSVLASSAPMVTLAPPKSVDEVSCSINIRVADIRSCYERWRARGAQFITEPKDLGGALRCYIRDPDGYLIEVGQAK